jgi:hypothetical protein
MAKNAPLTEDQKRRIKDGLRAGMTHRAVAAKVGVSAGVVQSVKTGRDRAGEKARREAREKAGGKTAKGGTTYKSVKALDAATRGLKIKSGGAKRTDKGPGAKRIASPSGPSKEKVAAAVKSAVDRGISKRVKVSTGKKGQGKA